MYAKSVNQTGLLLFLDFEKAFDSIEWQFIWRKLNKYKFGPTFITCVKTLYVDSKIIRKNNHWLSEEISLSRGIRQGCHISALLFIIATDVLAEHIQQELFVDLDNVTIIPDDVVKLLGVHLDS